MPCPHCGASLAGGKPAQKSSGNFVDPFSAGSPGRRGSGWPRWQNLIHVATAWLMKLAVLAVILAAAWYGYRWFYPVEEAPAPVTIDLRAAWLADDSGDWDGWPVRYDGGLLLVGQPRPLSLAIPLGDSCTITCTLTHQGGPYASLLVRSGDTVARVPLRQHGQRAQHRLLLQRSGQGLSVRHQVDDHPPQTIDLPSTSEAGEQSPPLPTTHTLAVAAEPDTRAWISSWTLSQIHQPGSIDLATGTSASTVIRSDPPVTAPAEDADGFTEALQAHIATVGFDAYPGTFASDTDSAIADACLRCSQALPRRSAFDAQLHADLLTVALQADPDHTLSRVRLGALLAGGKPAHRAGPATDMPPLVAIAQARNADFVRRRDILTAFASERTPDRTPSTNPSGSGGLHSWYVAPPPAGIDGTQPVLAHCNPAAQGDQPGATFTVPAGTSESDNLVIWDRRLHGDCRVDVHCSGGMAIGLRDAHGHVIMHRQTGGLDDSDWTLQRTYGRVSVRAEDREVIGGSLQGPLQLVVVPRTTGRVTVLRHRDSKR